MIQGSPVLARTDADAREETGSTSLPDRSDRHTMGADCASRPRSGAGRASGQGHQPRVGQCHPLPRAGTAWRLLAHEFPPWQTVYSYLRRRHREGVWDRVRHTLVMAGRERVGREAIPRRRSPGGDPPAAILDSRSVRTADQKGDRRATAQARGSTGATATSRPTPTEACSRLRSMGRHPGSEGSQRGPEALAGSLSLVRLACADRGYAGRLVRWPRNGPGLPWRWSSALGVGRALPSSVAGGEGTNLCLDREEPALRAR
jgi:putative transposase